MLLLSRTDTANLRHDNDPQVRCYRSQFSDQMEMLSASSQVEDYCFRRSLRVSAASYTPALPASGPPERERRIFLRE